MMSIEQVGGIRQVMCGAPAERFIPPIDLDWGEIDKYGTDREVRGYLLNRDVTCDYEEIN